MRIIAISHLKTLWEEYPDSSPPLSAWLNEPEAGTPQGDAVEVLITVIKAYEAKHFPMGLADPIDAIKFRWSKQGSPRDVRDSGRELDKADTG